MTWFKKKEKQLGSPPVEGRTVKTEGVFVKCEGCKEVLYRKDVQENVNVCPKCRHHFRIGARKRLEMLFDEAKFKERDGNLRSTDPLNFQDTKSYRDRLVAHQKASGLFDAMITGEGTVGGHPVVICSMEYSFIGGSMGSVVGEMITRAIERVIEKRWALIIIACSGGARMMEGVLSLMQLAKISAALARLEEERLPFISVMTDPTTGGVTASFAMLGDLNVAEPKALIGFAGPRVIEQTIRQKLPEGFQRSEFLLKHGMLDAVVDRRDLRDYLCNALEFMMSNGKPGKKSSRR
ncbi:MAG: acetyl-CoA carboxylase carboxyltransferase subunit beta [Acidobacteria bacterium]|nr:acetyl-CoA carboxylase carboxyltransferase subunit beta [Acidobacteriota bacterium]